MATIFELFPAYDGFWEIDSIIGYALDNARKYNESIFLVDHMVYGILKTFEKTEIENTSIYVNPKLYASKYIDNNYKRGGSFFCVEEDVYTLSHWYINFFKKMIVSNPKNSLHNVRSFYFLMMYMKRQRIFHSNIYIKGPSTEKDLILYKSFCKDLVNIINNKDKDLSLQSNNVNSIYASPIKCMFSSDLTNLAYEGKLEPFIGRENELKRLTNILNKMIKNNAVIIGNPGVGKTSIVNALAMRLVAGNIPDVLKDYAIIQIDVAASIAGCKYRGDFEKNISKIFEVIKSSDRKVILFIDEIHLIATLGKSDDETSLSLSDMIKPFLLDPKIRLIGASTFKDYKKLEADKSLERRFDTILVDEPSFEETIEILQYRKLDFEKNFNLEIPTTTLEEIVKLSKQYIPERFLPDKAIDVLDDACATKDNSSSANNATLTVEDIWSCISNLKGIPINKIRNNHNFENLYEELSSKIIGQKQAIDILCKAIRRTQTGLNDDNKPFASFLFVGPTGVGKTEIAKCLADSVFSGRENMIRLDMSEFMEENSVTKLIGSPPGYVGYQAGGKLTDAVYRHPYSLILFDEIEKAHPKVCNLLLQILDEGMLTDSHGVKVNFKNTIIILTSNAGVRELSKPRAGFGDKFPEKRKDILTSVKKQFSPELLNRLDEIIIFNNLTQEDIIKITKLCIKTEIIDKLNSKNISIDFSDEVIEQVAKQGYSSEYGVRELKRTISRKLKNPLADFLIEHPNETNISVKLVNNELDISSVVLVTC